MPVRLLLALPLLLAAACVTVGADPAPTTTALAPTFESATAPPPPPPEPTTGSAGPSAPTTTSTSAAPAATSDPTSPTEEPKRATPTAVPSTTTAPRLLESTITDPVGDATTRLGGSPGWADLAGGRLERRGGQMVLHVTLAEAAPSTAPDGHTFNVASFYDLDGDGSIDVEVWANLSDGGWDTAEFDNRAGRAAYSDEDSVDVGVTGSGLLELVFPATLLDSVDRLRWALASEYGSYEELSTRLASRDDAPDDDRPAAFPDS